MFRSKKPKTVPRVPGVQKSWVFFSPRVAGFGDNESGTLTIFAVYIFILMLMIGGMGVDLMRIERDRALLQSTLDRAVLAAADLDQELDPEAVVNDYFDKAGLSDYLTNVDPQEGLNYRIVSAEAVSTIDTQFMHMGGVETFDIKAASTAEERIEDVEISLVLDVSGSMSRNSRLTNLKVAAEDFIEEMFENTEEDKLSISIVPYATQVSVPSSIFNELKTSNEHDYSRCLNFDSNDFDSTSVSLTKTYERTMHFDPFYYVEGRDNDPKELVGLDASATSLAVCEAVDDREIIPISQNEADLIQYVKDFRAGGNTSLDIGMKWGSALLDPAFAPVVDELIEQDVVDDVFDTRPHEFNDSEAIKVIVLMTDGENTSQYYIRDDYREGESNIWWNDQEEVYSVYVGLDTHDDDDDDIYDEPMFYWPHEDEWKDHAYGEGTFEETNEETYCKSYKKNGSCKKYKTRKTTVLVDEPGSAEALTYADLWAYTSIAENVVENYEPWMYDSDAWNDWYYDVRGYVGSSTKDTRTLNICSASKDAGIIVFTIGFEAPSDVEPLLKSCASSDSHYFDVDGLEIQDAFSAIASSIRQLRLTQ